MKNSIIELLQLQNYQLKKSDKDLYKIRNQIIRTDQDVSILVAPNDMCAAKDRRPPVHLRTVVISYI